MSVGSGDGSNSNSNSIGIGIGNTNQLEPASIALSGLLVKDAIGGSQSQSQSGLEVATADAIDLRRLQRARAPTARPNGPMCSRGLTATLEARERRRLARASRACRQGGWRRLE